MLAPLKPWISPPIYYMILPATVIFLLSAKSNTHNKQVC